MNNISEILTEVKMQLQYLNEKFGETGTTNALLARLNSVEIGNLSDSYHSFNELYEFRKMYNAALFNQWAVLGKYQVHKSWKHHDGELCFGGGWFIVVAMLPTGQITNHYKAEDWDLFEIPEEEKALYEFDGHTPADVLQRLKGLSYSSIEFYPPPNMEAREKLNEYAEMKGWDKNKLIGWSEASDFAEWYAGLEKSASITEIVDFLERMKDKNMMAIEEFKESHPTTSFFFRGKADALDTVLNCLEFTFNKEQWKKKMQEIFGAENIQGL